MIVSAGRDGILCVRVNMQKYLLATPDAPTDTTLGPDSYNGARYDAYTASGIVIHSS